MLDQWNNSDQGTQVSCQHLFLAHLKVWLHIDIWEGYN